MFSFFSSPRGFSGDLDYRKKLQINQFIENLQGSNAYLVGTSKQEIEIYDILTESDGECLSYILEKIYENPCLFKKYATIIFETGYQKQKDKIYEKFKKYETSKDAKEIAKKEKTELYQQPPIHLLLGQHYKNR